MAARFDLSVEANRDVLRAGMFAEDIRLLRVPSPEILGRHLDDDTLRATRDKLAQMSDALDQAARIRSQGVNWRDPGADPASESPAR